MESPNCLTGHGESLVHKGGFTLYPFLKESELMERLMEVGFRRLPTHYRSVGVLLLHV